jgi:hypothetical protein
MARCPVHGNRIQLNHSRAVNLFDATPQPDCRRTDVDFIGHRSRHRSGDWRTACMALDLKPYPHQAVHTAGQRYGRALWPPTDCVSIKTLFAEWTFVIGYRTPEECTCWLLCCLGIQNAHRCPMAHGGLSPQRHLQPLLIPE